MDVVICGAGEVGGYAAEVLSAARHSVTLIDRSAEVLRPLGDVLDIRTLEGDATIAQTLAEAGVPGADLFVAATERDDVNLVIARMAKMMGSRKVVARVHSADIFESPIFDYRDAFGIDRMVCPEYSTALAIGHILRNPAALAMETFARGQIQLQEFRVAEGASGTGQPLSKVPFPDDAKIVALVKGKEVTVPGGGSVIDPGDTVAVVGNAKAQERVVRILGNVRPSRKKVAVLGGPPMAVWIGRALHDPNFLVRVFDREKASAERMAAEMGWVTVINADPTQPSVFDDENLEQLDTFIAATTDDKKNILACAWVKSMGVAKAIAVVQQTTYAHLLEPIGVNMAFSPRAVAAREISLELDDAHVKQVATLAGGSVAVYEVCVDGDAPNAGRSLRQMAGERHIIVAAVQRDGKAFVPSGDDIIDGGDTVLVACPKGSKKMLERMFCRG